MNSLFSYLFELNLSLVILYTAYKLFFEKDKNFIVRRIYLMGVIVLPFILPFLPESGRITLSGISPVSFNLEEITVFGSGSPQEVSRAVSIGDVVIIVYLLILSLGVFKLIVQLTGIIRAIIKSERMENNGTTLLSNPALHASSFFGYIFVDPDAVKKNSFSHILEHEMIHKREWHSIDRIIAELFVLINWFNPVAWLFRKSVIENLEYLADSAVLRNGTDPNKYQLSILNQYIGSASISNQFSSQIKKRINMLNKDYKLGSRWKLILIFPLVFIAFFIVSCADNNTTIIPEDSEIEVSDDVDALADKMPSFKVQDPNARSEVFYVVEEMPKFNDGDPAQEFRKYIAQNLRYPDEAKANGATGRVIISFIVSSNGKVIIPNKQDLSDITDENLDEVVVVSYRPLNKEDQEPEEKYIQMFREEVIRVISQSPDWTPGKQRGIDVNVMFTFPVNFIMQ